MPSIPMDVLYEDNHLLAVNKPAGIATMGALAGRTSVVTLMRQYIKEHYGKPGNVYLGVVSRLDAPVSGVLLLARTSKAADRLTHQFGSRTPRKIYWAAVHPSPNQRQAVLLDWLRHDDAARRVVVTQQNAAEAKEARLKYRVLRNLTNGSLLEIELETGRKHQIRVQLSRHGTPVIGDRKYASSVPFSPGIALHSRVLEVVHPVKKIPLRFEAPLPSSWRKLGLVEE